MAQKIEGGIAPGLKRELLVEASTFISAGNPTGAANIYARLLANDPDDIDGLNNLAVLSSSDEAEKLLSRAVSIDPRHIQANLNLAQIYLQTGRIERAKSHIGTLMIKVGLRAQPLFLLSKIFQQENNMARAIAACRRALIDENGTAQGYYELGYLQLLDETLDVAIASFDKAIELDPNHAEAHIFRGHAYLKRGDYSKGGEGLTWIWKKNVFGDQNGIFVDRVGRLKDLSGQTIVLSSDSGLGDTLQFFRYAEILRKKGASIVFHGQPELFRLLENSNPHICHHKQGSPVPRFDHRLPIHNLIAACGTTIDTIPGDFPYLTAPAKDVTRWRERLARFGGIKVGLVWGGNPNHAHNSRRSISLDLMQELLAVEGVTFVSLQQQAVDEVLGILDFSAELDDMASTAGLVQNLDLVISVDTAVVHLSGGLGRPVWMLNRFDGCWRWLEGRDDSPWYPTLRQFRQQNPGDWQDVIAEVRRALSQFVDRRAGSPITMVPTSKVA
jgi:tetratricopeptide (TPR) repeat protein